MKLRVTLTPFTVQIPITPHYHSFLFQVHTCISPHLHLQKRFPTCILGKDRFYANPMIRWCRCLGRISEVDSTVAADSNCEADVTCEWWILNEVVIGFINLLERASSKLTNFNVMVIYAYSLNMKYWASTATNSEVPHTLPEPHVLARYSTQKMRQLSQSAMATESPESQEHLKLKKTSQVSSTIDLSKDSYSEMTSKKRTSRPKPTYLI